MAIPKVNPRTIMLVGKELSLTKELAAGGAITPGDQLIINSSGAYIRHGTAGLQGPRIVADAVDYNGKGIDDAYASGDWVFAWVINAGVEINATVAAAAPAIVRGDFLTSAGDGTLKKTTTPAEYSYMALESVDNSAGGSKVRIKAIAI